MRAPHPEQVVAENEHFERLQTLHVVRDLGQLVRAQVQLHHLRPRSDV